MRIAVPMTTGTISEDNVTLEIAITPELRKQVQAKMNFNKLDRVELRVPTYASLVDETQLQSYIPASLSPRKSEQGEEHLEIYGQSFIPDDSYFRNREKRGVWAFYVEVDAIDIKKDTLHVTFVSASEHLAHAPSNMLIAVETGRVIVTGEQQQEQVA